MHVASVIHMVGGSWDLESMHNLISEEDCMEVSNIQVGDSKWEDRHIDPAVWHGIWRVEALPKIRHFLWRGIKGALATIGNEEANYVARFHGTEMSDSTWVDRPPSSLVRILNKDGLPCPPS
ncbi:hypothetical protein PS2_012763 [Malus domestica]